MTTRILAIAAATLLAPASFAQPGSITGLDAALVQTRGLQVNGRNGSFPNGESGLSSTIDICNFGSTIINWFAPMNPDHPMYSQMVARDLGFRFEQISDRSYVKHGFASINGGVCGGCVNPGSGALLGLNCSDTYGAGLNANTFYLGPPAEINPWTGAWNPVGSHFDMGFPPVSGGAASDGSRSNINVPGGVTFRVRVSDADMNTSAAFYYGHYVIVPNEPGTAKDNNGVYRRFTPTWTGSTWNFSNNTGSVTQSSMLENWGGAKLGSAGNGPNGDPVNDGKFYVGMKVSGPDGNGMWHYEYAVHNRDNSRGADQFTIPVCPGTVVSNITFGDIDNDGGNEWTGQQVGDNIVWTGPSANSLEWNTIYNFAFDADAGPMANGTVNLRQARAGAGTAAVDVVIDTPGAQFDTFIGAPCGNPNLMLDVSGLVPAPTLPNPFFGLGITGAGAGNTVGFSFSAGNVATDFGNGCVWQLDFATSAVLAGIPADGTGFARLPLPLPNVPGLAGIPLFFQATELVVGGPVFGVANLSNALRVNLGNVGPTSCN
ncbi:MAG: hypothetical protein AAF196_13235 [Planctomycetota bacterium]